MATRVDRISMLAQDWDGRISLTGYLLSEKKDGVRGRWTGEKLVTRYENEIHAPDWFLAGLPKGVALDGELWIKRGYFHETSGIVRRARPRIGGVEWRAMRFHVFDAPELKVPASRRLALIPSLIAMAPYAVAIQHVVAPNNDVVLRMLDLVLSAGGEGLMAICPDNEYKPGRRVSDFVKVKVWQEAEAVVVKRNETKDSVRCVLPKQASGGSGVEFDVGLPSVRDRAHPPKPGETITFRFFTYEESGKPRHPTYKGVRDYE
jgi:DNA ligase-1